VTTPPLPIPQAFRSIPLSLRAGDAHAWEIALPWVPTGTVTLSYVLTGVVCGVPTRIIINSGDIAEALNVFTMTVPSSESKAWTPGSYEWLCFLTDSSGNRHPIAEGHVKILPDVAGSANPIDPRTDNEKTLWAVNQLIKGRAVADVNMYEIAGRKLAKMTIKELMYFRGVVSAWVRKERKARGQYVRPNAVGVNFRGLN
jgi:hypothetical protein